MHSDLDTRLLGAWLLQRWQIAYPGRVTAVLPFGADASGLLVYVAAPDSERSSTYLGWMSATMSRAQRTPLANAAHGEYLTYGGRWWVEGQRVHHQVLWSMNPQLLGTVQLRDASFVDEQLQLTAFEVDPSNPSRGRTHLIKWRRAHGERLSVRESQ